MKAYESIIIDKNAKDPMYLQLYKGIKNLIDDGVMLPEEKLPTIRSISEKYQVNNVTVVNAYKLLEKKGYVYSKVGSGTYVKGVRENEQGNESLDAETIEQGFVKMNQNEINFATSTPNPVLFPVQDFKELLNEVLDRDGGCAFGYQESQGYYPLRESITDYLLENGLEVMTNNVHIISGAQQGIDIVAKALIGFNDTIIVESPTYTGATAVFKSRGAKIIEISMEADGMNMKELEAALATVRPKLVYMMTSFQNPTGISYSNAKKQRLLQLAERHGFYILEDDYLSELNFYGEVNKPLKAMDKANKVIYLKSFSKIFMPGIRLAFLIPPDNILQRIISAKHITDISTAGLMQRAMDLYLRKRIWEKHIDMMFEVYKKRYDQMVKLLKRETPFVRFSEPGGGLHIWAETDVDATLLCNAAKLKGAPMAPGTVFYLDNRNSKCFRMSFAGVDETEITKGIELIRLAYLSVKNTSYDNIFPFV